MVHGNYSVLDFSRLDFSMDENAGYLYESP